MDAAEIRARVLAGLSFEHALGDTCWQLRLPTRQRERELVRAHAGGGTLDQAAFSVALVREGVTGWSGVRLGDLLGAAEADAATPLAFDADTCELLLAERTDWLDALAVAMLGRMQARRDALEAAEKNFASVSSGN